MAAAPTVPTGATALFDGQFNVGRTAPISSSTGWTRTSRQNLSDEGLVKFRENFIKKIIKVPVSSNLNVTSYKASEMEDKNNFFNAIATWTNSSMQFQSYMRTHFVDTVFVIMKLVTTTTTSTNGTRRDVRTVHQVDSLFKIWNNLTLDEVYASCEIFYNMAQDAVDSQNLNLSWEFLMMNIDLDLKAIVNAELSSYMERNATIAQSGPMAYHVIANRIIRCTTGLSHHVVTGMMGMGLIHYKGENVVDCVATLRNVLLFLGHGTPRSQCPPTLMKILVDVFLRCTNPVFVSYVRNLHDFHNAEIDTPEKLFSKIQVYYNELLMKPNGWLKTTKNRGAFHASLPELMEVMASQGAFTDPSALGIPLDIDVPTPRKRCGGRNDGTPTDPSANAAGGNDPPPTDNTNQKDAQGRWTHDRAGNPIDRVAPTNGQPKVRTTSTGGTERWCSQCDRWGNHGDEKHDDFVARRNNRRNRNRNNGGGSGNGNDANGNGNSQVPPSMHATAAQILAGRWNVGYESDGSF